MGVYIEDYVPVVKYEGLNTQKNVSFEGTLAVTGNTTIGTGSLTVTTGNITLSANGAGISFTGTGTNGGILTNLYNATASTLSGTQRDVRILIGTVPYYFTVYPTKA